VKLISNIDDTLKYIKNEKAGIYNTHVVQNNYGHHYLMKISGLNERILLK